MNTVIALAIRKLVELNMFFMSSKSVIFSTTQNYFYTELRRTILKTLMNPTKKSFSQRIYLNSLLWDKRQPIKMTLKNECLLFSRIRHKNKKLKNYFLTILECTNQSTEFSWIHWIQLGVLIYQISKGEDSGSGVSTSIDITSDKGILWTYHEGIW